MGQITKKWGDSGCMISKIEHLNFPADRYWKYCQVTITATKGTCTFKVNVDFGGEYSSSSEMTLKKGESHKLRVNPVDRCCYINVTGQISGFFVGGEVSVTCEYDDKEVLESKAVSWGDETIGISCIQNLCLPNEHLWRECEIKVEGYKNNSTGIMVTLLVNGELKFPIPEWTELNGTESKIFTYIIQEKVPLVVAGYITNHKIVTKGGAKITLTGFYKKGE